MKITTLIVFLGLSGAAMAAAPEASYAWHTVEKGQTMYSISRLYGIKPAELASYNDAVGTGMEIKVGQKLRVPATAGEKAIIAAPVVSKPVPVAAPAVVRAAPKENTSDASETVHVVKKGETFYSISRQYGVDRGDLQSWNELQDLNLNVGQKLIIHQGQPAAQARKVSEPVREVTATATASMTASDNEAARKTPYINIIPTVKEPRVSTNSGDVTASTSMASGLSASKTVKSWKTETASERMEMTRANTKPAYDPASEYESVYYQSIYSGMPKKTDKGVAKLTLDNNQAYIAYYNNATVGTILRITNVDNGRTTYAVVVGKLPEAETGAYTVKLSDRAARAITLKDYSSVELVCYTGN